MTTTVEVLRKARALIDTPEKWIKGVEAQDADGDLVMPTDRRAVCWCAVGAIEAVAPDGGILNAARAFAIANNVSYAYQFNDLAETTHADILAAFDRAIAAEEAKA